MELVSLGWQSDMGIENRGSKPPMPCSHIQLWKRLQERLEEKSGVGAPKAVRHCIQPRPGSPATALVSKCSDPVVFLVPSRTWRGGTCCMVNNLSSISHRPGMHPTTLYTHTTSHHTWRGHSSFTHGVDTTREQPIPVISHCSTEVERSTRDRLVGGRDFLLDSYRPPQAGQPPASKGRVKRGWELMRVDSHQLAQRTFKASQWKYKRMIVLTMFLLQ